jgi:glycosyltransferase involved in cell wall biosynthesis
MNIWFISKYASTPNFAKIPSRLFYIAKESKKLGNNITFITSDSNHLASFPATSETYNYLSVEGIQVCWIKTIKFVKTASFRRVLSWIDFERKLYFLKLKDKFQVPDVVYISSLSIFTILYGYYLKKKYGSLLVFEIRDIWPLTMTEEGNFSNWHPLVILIGLVEKFGYTNADIIVGTMPKLDLHVKNILGYERPFYCFPLGFDPQMYGDNNITDDNFSFKNIPSDKKIIGYAGSMGITNALETFIDAIKLMEDIPEIHFVLVGSGDLRNKYITELKGFSNVTFLDRIPQSEVNKFLSHCDILYLSTKNSKVWEFGQSMNKIVEYMLAGKPIIANYSGYKTMINEADCGEFVDNFDPQEIKEAIIRYAFLTKENLHKIGENGRKWIWENRQYSQLTKTFLDYIDAKMTGKK